MPRAHRKSDDIYNARRRAKRALEKATNIFRENSKSSKAEKFIKQIQSLESIINNSYIDKQTNKYKYSISNLNKKIESKLSKINTFKFYRNTNEQNDRLSKMQEEKFNQHGNMSRWEQSKFYRFYQSIWENNSPEDRNNAIVDYLRDNKVTLKNGDYIENLQDAFKYFEEQNESEIERRKRANKLSRMSKKMWTTDDLNFMIEYESEKVSAPPAKLSHFEAYA